MRKYFCLLFYLLCSFIAFSQRNGTVKGIAIDTISKQAVGGATITILDRKDSSLVSFTMTDNLGRFELKGLSVGEYRLLVTHVNYYNVNRYFQISDSVKQADLGNVILSDKSKVLEEVVLASEAPPVTMINDTIQYNAGSFKVQPNASVEQLLKKLPGVKVEKDGTVKAQGEKVNRILVDGKEFFGNDPKVATRNLPADAVDKVQVYDRQSDQAQLTGFEDGNSEKTINLKLKKDKKKGVFGKLNAGAGTDNRYTSKFNVNSFKGARQLSAIGMANNVNAEGFSFMDILNFTGELARMQRGGGGNININMNADEAAALGVNGGGQNNGINTAWGGGLNYNNIIGSKLDLQSNYFYNNYNPRTKKHVAREFLLPDSTYSSLQDVQSNNRNSTNRINLNFLFQADSMNSIRFVPSYSMQHTSNFSASQYETRGGNKALANEGFSNSDNENDGYNFRNELTWRKKFARRGRSFSLQAQSTNNRSEGSGSLYTINKFYDPMGSLRLRDTINQHYITESRLDGYTLRAVYTEPFWKRSLLEMSASQSYTRNISEKTTYDYNTLNGKYDALNEKLTNDFQNIYNYQQAGLRWRKQGKKYNYSFGASWQRALLEGKITSGDKDSVISKTFRNILPTARFQYNFSKFKSVAFNYSTSTNQPSMVQLQPVPDNSDPLNIREGNPQLKPEYTHLLQANMNFVSPYKNRNFFLFLTLRATSNRIVNSDSVNHYGVKTTKPVNVDGFYNLNSNISYSMPVRFLKGTVEVSSATGYSIGKQFVNRQQNEIRTFNVGPEVRFDLNPTDKLNIGFGGTWLYNHSAYSLLPDLDNSYLSQEFSASADLQVGSQWFISSDFTYTINTQRAIGFNSRIPIWNASLSRQVLRYNRGEIKLAASDLLNRNIGIRRTANNNYIEDSRVMTLRRFFLLSFTYSLSKTGLSRNEGGGVRVIR